MPPATAPLRSPRRNPARRLVRLGACLVALAAVAVAPGCSGSSGQSQAPTTTVPATTTTTTIVPLEQGEQHEVYVPVVGDCFDRRLVEEEGRSGHVPLVLTFDCSLPHMFEVFSVLGYPGAGTAYPTDEVLRTYARSACLEGFEAYVGQAYVLSQLDIDHYIPSATDWERGARTIGCSLVSTSGERLTGSALGSGR